MKFIAAILACLTLASILCGCPKSNDMMDQSKKSGNLVTNPSGGQEVTQGTAPAGGK